MLGYSISMTKTRIMAVLRGIGIIKNMNPNNESHRPDLIKYVGGAWGIKLGPSLAENWLAN